MALTTRWIGILLLFGQLVSAQDSVLLTKNFQFTDGIYLNFEDLQNNKPTFAWEEIEATIFTNPQTLLTQISSISLPDGTNNIALPTDRVFAISMAGVPYLQINADESNKDLATFAALKVRGKLCYYGFPSIETKAIEMHAFNPKNGLPFRTSTIEREEEVFVEKLLDFETGETVDFTVANFINRISDDPKLIETIRLMPEVDRQSKLFKCLLIYDDRNHYYFK